MTAPDVEDPTTRHSPTWGDGPREGDVSRGRLLLAGASALVGLANVPVLLRLLHQADGSSGRLVLLGGVLMTVVLGLLLRWSGLPDGVGVALLTLGLFAPILLVAAWLLAPLHDTTAIGLAAALPALVISALVTANLVELTVSPQGSAILGAVVIAIVLAVLGVLTGLVGDALTTEQQRAEQVATLEASSLAALLPELEGWEREFGSVETTDGEATRYWFQFSAPSDGVPSTSGFTVDVALDDDPCLGPMPAECREQDGYEVVDDYAEVQVLHGETRLSVRLSDSTPSVAEVGEMLVEAEPSDWVSVVSAG